MARAVLRRLLDEPAGLVTLVPATGHEALAARLRDELALERPDLSVDVGVGGGQPDGVLLMGCE